MTSMTTSPSDRRYRTIPEIRREMVKALANQMREKQGKEPIRWADEAVAKI